ncbi:unnamed protein product, partial [Protopolystoma xenopodis]
MLQLSQAPLIVGRNQESVLSALRHSLNLPYHNIPANMTSSPASDTIYTIAAVSTDALTSRVSVVGAGGITSGVKETDTESESILAGR